MYYSNSTKAFTGYAGTVGRLAYACVPGCLLRAGDAHTLRQVPSSADARTRYWRTRPRYQSRTVGRSGPLCFWTSCHHDHHRIVLLSVHHRYHIGVAVGLKQKTRETAASRGSAPSPRRNTNVESNKRRAPARGADRGTLYSRKMGVVLAPWRARWHGSGADCRAACAAHSFIAT